MVIEPIEGIQIPNRNFWESVQKSKLRGDD